MNSLLYHLKHGKLSSIGKPIFLIMITIELQYERFLNAWVNVKQNTELVDSELTAIIKTFERPTELKRLVQSIRCFYPNLKIIVVDDSRVPSVLDGVETIVMPFDSGVSAGRNRALAEVKTKYTLLLDDDYVFYRKTGFNKALQVMEECSEIDIMGGERVDLPLYRAVNYRQSRLFPVDRDSVKPSGSLVASMPVYDKVANFYIARTERLRLVSWDDSLKRLDHADFFSRAKGVLLTVFNKDFKVLHAQTPYNKVYMSKRFSIDADRKRLHEKYYVLKTTKTDENITNE